MVSLSRRHLHDEPHSRWAIWARRLAFFAIAVALLGVVITRSGFIEVVPSLAILAGALAVAGLAIVAAFAAFVVIWRQGLDGLRYAIIALAISAALLVYPAYLGWRAYKLPAIADIVTDPIDPPRFEAVARLRPRGANPVAYAGLYVAELQRTAYPDIEPLELNASPMEAYEAALALINKRKWRVVDSRPPIAGRRDGHIEAVARTLIMGFRDDVVVRVRVRQGTTIVDMRSASRYGRHDLGANAARVRSLLEDIEELADTEKPVKRQPREQKRPPQPPAKR